MSWKELGVRENCEVKWKGLSLPPPFHCFRFDTTHLSCSLFSGFSKWLAESENMFGLSGKKTRQPALMEINKPFSKLSAFASVTYWNVTPPVPDPHFLDEEHSFPYWLHHRSLLRGHFHLLAVSSPQAFRNLRPFFFDPHHSQAHPGCVEVQCLNGSIRWR